MLLKIKMVDPSTGTEEELSDEANEDIKRLWIGLTEAMTQFCTARGMPPEHAFVALQLLVTSFFAMGAASDRAARSILADFCAGLDDRLEAFLAANREDDEKDEVKH